MPRADLGGGFAGADRTLHQSLVQAGAVMVVRDSHEVAAHYGSVAAELAVCVTHVGAAVRSDLDVIEMTGAAGRLARTLRDALGVPRLEPGAAATAAGAWCCLVAPDLALLIGAPAVLDRCRRLARQHAARAGHPIGCVDRSAEMTALTLVGPHARALLVATALPADLPAAHIRACTLGRAPALLLHERDGRYLLLMSRDRAVDACRELVRAGRRLELSFVGLDALDRLSAVARPAVPVG